MSGINDLNENRWNHRFDPTTRACVYCGLAKIDWLADAAKPNCQKARPDGLGPHCPPTPAEAAELDAAGEAMADILNTAFDNDPSRLAAGMKERLAS